MTGQQLELIQLPALQVSVTAGEGGIWHANVSIPGSGKTVPGWFFTVGRDGDGWALVISHWMPGPCEWSPEITCRSVFRRRPVPHDATSMAAFARWMLTGEEGS